METFQYQVMCKNPKIFLLLSFFNKKPHKSTYKFHHEKSFDGSYI